HHDEDGDQNLVDDGTLLERGRHEHRRDQNATRAERRAHRRGMDPHEEVRQPKEADRSDQRQEPGGDQQQRAGHRDPERQRGIAHGSITSPRSRNFASAIVLAKPNSAIKSAMSKYTVELERIPSISSVSMPCRSSVSCASTRSCAAGPIRSRTSKNSIAITKHSDANHAA